MIETISYGGGFAAYQVTLVYVVCQFLFIACFGLIRTRRSHSIRPSNDPTWFLGVHFWGIESTYRLIELAAHDGGGGFLLATGVIVVALVVAASLLAEAAARRVGLGARPAGATVPAGVVAIVLGVLIPWAIWVPFPPRMAG